MNPSTIDSRYLCYLLDYFYSFLSKCLSVFEEVSANRHTSLILRDIAWKSCRRISLKIVELVEIFRTKI